MQTLEQRFFNTHLSETVRIDFFVSLRHLETHWILRSRMQMMICSNNSELLRRVAISREEKMQIIDWKVCLTLLQKWLTGDGWQVMWHELMDSFLTPVLCQVWKLKCFNRIWLSLKLSWCIKRISHANCQIPELVDSTLMMVLGWRKVWQGGVWECVTVWSKSKVKQWSKNSPSSVSVCVKCKSKSISICVAAAGGVQSAWSVMMSTEVTLLVLDTIDRCLHHQTNLSANFSNQLFLWVFIISCKVQCSLGNHIHISTSTWFYWPDLQNQL